MEKVLFVNPIFHYMLWGGRKLETVFGYDIPDGPVGECWAISAHPHGDCTVKGGEFNGVRLSALWEEHRELFDNIEGDRFPLLIKILDAKDDLAVQVHPDDAYAREHEDGSLRKSECWYFLDCDDGVEVIVGQKARTRVELAEAIERGEWDRLLNRIPVHTGDFFQIDPGCVHAVLAGTLVYEAQQSSDITYRLYDFDRPDADGNLRELHISQSLDTVDYDMTAPVSGAVTAPEIDGVTVLERNDKYTVKRISVAGGVNMRRDWPFLCVSVISGCGEVAGSRVNMGDHLIVTAAADELTLAGDMELLVTHP